MTRHWWPAPADLATDLARVEATTDIAGQWRGLVSAARQNLDFAATLRIDRFARRVIAPRLPEAGARIPRTRVVLLSTSTTSHLVASLRVGALTRGLWLDIHEAAYGQIHAELANPASTTAAFLPDMVVFLHAAEHLVPATSDQPFDIDERVDEMRALWTRARDRFGADVIQQIPLNTYAPLLGENENRHADTPRARMRRLAERLRDAADAANVDIVDCEAWATRVGATTWRDRGLWLRAKQDVSPAAAPLFGDVVARVIAARRGRSAKCLALDLDNTLWGGVVGDDGVAGLALGPGSAAGEAHLALQLYARDLSRRGVLLAVCSKNDEAIAREAFERHPEMALKRDDIACFVANWNDKASNLRGIAARLNIGLDSIVFADDNPFERNLAREHAPEVATLEIGDDPAGYVAALSESGLFEAVGLTDADMTRAVLYRDAGQRDRERRDTTDLDGYLAGLGMTMTAGPFDELNIPRVAQLANKTNQFNLTTRRLSEAQAREIGSDSANLTLAVRLADKHGDHGLIAVLIARIDEASGDGLIDNWLMSCRVLGRGVEQACLNLLATIARARGASALVGKFVASGRNDMVREHYAKLGFLSDGGTDEAATWRLPLATFAPLSTHVAMRSAP